eukprot:1347601-Amphidinium_carterae.1
MIFPRYMPQQLFGYCAIDALSVSDIASSLGPLDKFGFGCEACGSTKATFLYECLDVGPQCFLLLPMDLVPVRTILVLCERCVRIHLGHPAPHLPKGVPISSRGENQLPVLVHGASLQPSSWGRQSAIVQHLEQWGRASRLNQNKLSESVKELERLVLIYEVVACGFQYSVTMSPAVATRQLTMAMKCIEHMVNLLQKCQTAKP